MKEVRVSYTYLDIIEFSDDTTDEEIQDYLEEHAPAPGYNDIEWDQTRKDS